MTMKEKYRIRKEKGLCTRCGGDRGTSTTLICDKCKEYFKGDRELKLKLQICPICGKNPIRGNEKTCFECLDKAKVKQKEYREKNKDILYAKKRAYFKNRTVKLREQGLCTKCGKRKPSSGRATCPICSEKASYYGRMRYIRRNQDERV